MLHEAPSHWRHFPQFFLVLHEFAQLGTEERAWMLRRCVVTQLVDFYLGDESPLAGGDGPYHRPKRTRMGDKFALPNLEHMLALISLLCRSASRPYEQADRTPLSLDGTLLVMEAQEHQLAVCAPFLGKVLKEGLNVHALSDLVQHYCYMSQATSGQIFGTVLHGIDTMDSESLGPYLHLFTAIVGLSDGLLQWRTQWAMPRLLRVIAANMRYKQATIACLRMLTSLCQQPLPRQWMLAHQQNWLQEWLIGGHTDAVRVAAEELVCSILAAELPPAEAAQAADGLLQPCPRWIAHIYDYLQTLLVIASDIARDSGPDVGAGKAALDDQPSPRLAPYFRVCIWCARHGAAALVSAPQANTPNMRLQELQTAYIVQDSHHWECDETKLEMIRFWLEAASAPGSDRVHGALALAANPQVFRKLLDTFVSLRPNERFLLYNRDFLPPFYGLLRAVIANAAGGACVQVLQTHRNWEWAIRYVLVEGPDYAQLPADGEPEGSLGQSLMFLLRSSCASADFRNKVLATTLGCKKLPHNAANILTLLELTIVDDEGLDTAIELEALPQLCSCLDGAQGSAYIENQRWRQLHGLLHLVWRLAQRLRIQTKDDEPRRQRLLQVWDSYTTGSAQSLLNMVFVLLRASLRLRLDAAGRAPMVRSDNVLRSVPPMQLRPLQAVCFDLAVSLAALSCQWASLIVASLLIHHGQRAPQHVAPAEPAIGPPAAAASGSDANGGGGDVSADRPDTLAGLSMEEARRAAAANAERLCMYYEFAHLLIVGSVRAHDDPNVLSNCMRLAVMLATETSVLPRSHAKFTQLLTQVAKARPNLVAAGVSHEAGEALLRRLLAEEPALLLQCVESREYCLEMLRLAPPSEAQLCTMLDACAARILELRGSAADGDEEMGGLQQAVQLLRSAGTAADEHWEALRARTPGL